MGIQDRRNDIQIEVLVSLEDRRALALTGAEIDALPEPERSDVRRRRNLLLAREAERAQLRAERRGQ